MKKKIYFCAVRIEIFYHLVYYEKIVIYFLVLRYCHDGSGTGILAGSRHQWHQ